MPIRSPRLLPILVLAACCTACGESQSSALAQNARAAQESGAQTPRTSGALSVEKTSGLQKKSAALAALEAGKPEEALKLYDEMIAADARDIAAKINRTVCLSQLKRTSEALVASEECLQLAPADPDAHMNRATLLSEVGQLDEALKHVDTALRLGGSHPRPLLLKVTILNKLGRGEEALRILDGLPQADPWLDMIRFNRARVLDTLGRAAEAEAAWQQLLQLHPDDAQLKSEYQARPAGSK